MSVEPNQAIELFYCYAHEDEKLREQLEKHLSSLKREGVITDWHNRKIGAGKEWQNEIDTHLNTSHIILLLISPNFMYSNYCWDVEVKRAMERYEAQEARVIPVILESVDWINAPFGRLQPLPERGKPVKKWGNRNDAFLSVAKGIRIAAKELAENL
ncbi:toll/interleukin-1 receptor domain-containing protein [aff. Roholtiella sp. LEGE 12411]|nr:toll/interleukin-1 receptor domain-containing protein [aff. Roholtiella sp. LEGE 12411]